jgi:hypothetical protein
MITRRGALPILAAFLVIILAGTGAKAQESASIQALATVVSSLQIVGSNNLQFGTVTPGVNKSVDKSSIGFAGEWTVNGSAVAEITLTFTLPDSMYTVDSLAAMRIGFSSTDASYEDGTGAGQTAPAGVIDPNGPLARRLAADGSMFVWIGGQVFPRISQTGGAYAGEIVLTVAYTGS